MNMIKNLELDEAYNWLLTVGINVAIALAIGAVAYYTGKHLLSRIISQFIKGTRQHEWHKKDIEKRQKTLVQLFATIWRFVVLFTVGYSVLRIIFGDTISTTMAPLFASAGIIGIAIGIGAQSLIRDFLSGIFIITENQYRVGDIVDIEGAVGTVERIGTRSTVIRDVEGNVHYLPNGMVQHVINKTMGYSMARFSVAVHPSTDIEKASKKINLIGKKLAEESAWSRKIIEAPTFISVGEISGSSVELIISGKTQPSDQWGVIAEMRRRLLELFEKESIQLAVTPMANRAAKK